MLSKSKLIPIILSIPLVIYTLFELAYFNSAYPNLYIGNINVSQKNSTQLQKILSDQFKKHSNQTIIFNLNTGKPITINLTDKILKYDTEKTINQILSYGRSGSILSQLTQKLSLLTTKKTLNPIYDFDNLTFDTLLADSVRQYEKPVLETKLVYLQTGLALTPQKSGVIANREKALQDFQKYIHLQSDSPIFQITLETKNPQITRENSQKILEQATLATSRTITLKSEKIPDRVWTLNGPELYDFLELKYDQDKKQPFLELANYKIASYSAQFEPLIKKDPIEAKFETVGSQTVVLESSQDGYTLDSEQLTKQITQTAFNSDTSSTIEIPIKNTSPAVTMNKVNQFGIKELIATGQSIFKGSSQGRTHNIEVASEKLNGALIKPGQTFSMYQTVGDIEKDTGFVDSAIIKNGRTISGVGGGVCQLSTTLFRAALNAGFPVIERDPHSYRVKYYELDSGPGFDAAIYFPNQDFKFTNNTENNALIQIKIDKEKGILTANIYGVKDNRSIQISEAKITDQIDPPPEVRFNDDTIPVGTTRQTEFSATGATVSFNRTVTRDSQPPISDTFTSIYRPWQAVYLIGTKEN